MHLAYVIKNERGATDLILTEFAQNRLQNGYRVAGVVQTNSAKPDTHHCDMDVQVLPDGPSYRISQSLGKEARGCRLDTSALELSVAALEHSLTKTPELLVINKFGKHEADGRGFREVIAKCLADGIPVLVGVNQLNYEAFLDFSGDLAQQISPDIDALSDWLDATQTHVEHAA
ncbi:DUF2478 domain-containing protein [Aestuariibius sp. HNIBRBA575]|uniref:DUF2478 domain-containing protein n=1 Tax=Aestuariibius sp. HNIBRBA575 TaxID=3233343 RepID=UPI0034A4CC47